jgi:hypothetical protein
MTTQRIAIDPGARAGRSEDIQRRDPPGRGRRPTPGATRPGCAKSRTARVNRDRPFGRAHVQAGALPVACQFVSGRADTSVPARKMSKEARIRGRLKLMKTGRPHPIPNLAPIESIVRQRLVHGQFDSQFGDHAPMLGAEFARKLTHPDPTRSNILAETD